MIENNSISQILLNILTLELIKIWTGNTMFLILQQNWIEQMLSFLRSGILSILTHGTIYLLCNLWITYYANVIWAQNFNVVNRVPILQKKALRTISFQPRDCHWSPLFKKQNLLKFEDKIQLENVLLGSKYFNNILPSIFDKWFTLCSDIHNYNKAASTGKLFKPSFWNNLFGKNSITVSVVNAWNKIQTVFGNVILKNLTTSQIKTPLTKKCIEKYYLVFILC